MHRPPMEVVLRPETPQKMLGAALVRINEGSLAGCTEAVKAERLELWESIRFSEAAADEAVLAGDHVSTRSAIQGLEDAWAAANDCVTASGCTGTPYLDSWQLVREL